MKNNANKKKMTASEYVRIFIYVTTAVLFLLIIGNVLSKYVYRNNGQSQIIAHEFYFSSDYLIEGGKEYTLTPGTTKVDIELYNAEDNLRFSTDKAKYTVFVNGTQTAEGELLPNAKSTATVTISGLSDGESYEVVAVGDAGFKKTLSATFRVLEQSTELYKSVKNTDDYVLLTVWAEAGKGELTVTFPDTLIPDNTDAAMADVKTADGSFVDEDNFTQEFSSHSYRFFKPTSASVTADSFDVTLNGQAATEKTPDK